MHAYLHCLSHTPLVGFVDPEQAVLDEVNRVIADARRRIAEFDPELVVLFAPDHYNGFFYDVMPPFCLGVGATAIGDFASAAGDLPVPTELAEACAHAVINSGIDLAVPTELAEACAHAVINSGIDLAVSYNMQVDHGFAQPLEFLLGGLDRVPVLPVFINGVAAPLPGFQRTRLLGEAMGRFLNTLNKRLLILGSGGLSHQPPVPELAKADAHLRDRLLGGGKQLPPDERERRQQRVINAARRFTEDPHSLHPLNPVWDNRFMSLLEQGRLSELDAIGNDELSAMAGKSTHEIKTWVAAFAALSAFGRWRSEGRYYRPIPEWIAGFGSLSATTEI
ncbi:3-carboxyethylcatechol 2,3-dioxygenase [Klebsiella pneumoniae]|nr:3-carboxyethylcatechol 2,3-dioxygenase [Klebsiella pneumoniae]